MNAIIDVGGGTRGIYGAGVFDRCIDDGIVFDAAVGVSAGAANCASYCAGQKGRNYVYYTEYTQRPEYLGVKALLASGSLLDLDYVYGVLSNEGGEYPLDYDAYISSPVDMYIVATDARTGKPVYFSKNDTPRNEYDFIKASCCLPVVCRPYTVGGQEYFDGGLSDPLPYAKTREMGADKIVIILTKPRGAELSQTRNTVAAKLIAGKYPNAALSLTVSNEIYSHALRLAEKAEEEGSCLIIDPDDIGDLGTLSRDKDVLDALYHKGYDDAGKIKAFLES